MASVCGLRPAIGGKGCQSFQHCTVGGSGYETEEVASGWLPGVYGKSAVSFVVRRGMPIKRIMGDRLCNLEMANLGTPLDDGMDCHQNHACQSKLHGPTPHVGNRFGNLIWGLDHYNFRCGE